MAEKPEKMENTSSIIGIANEVVTLYSKIKELNNNEVEKKIIIFLEIVQKSLMALGNERQAIITEASLCRFQNVEDLLSLQKKLTIYLKENHIYPHLEEAVVGLRGCQDALVKKANSWFSWRNRAEKNEAVKHFISSMAELTNELQALIYDASPQYSGQGVSTLVPLKEFLDKKLGLNQRPGIKITNDELEEYAQIVIHAELDIENLSWIQRRSGIRGLIIKIKLAFLINDSIGQ